MKRHRNMLLVVTACGLTAAPIVLSRAAGPDSSNAEPAQIEGRDGSGRDAPSTQSQRNELRDDRLRQVSVNIAFQGRFLDANGVALTGLHQLFFRIFDTDGILRYENMLPIDVDLTNTNGVASTQIPGVPDTVFDKFPAGGASYTLHTSLDDPGFTSPFVVELLPTPFSVTARDTMMLRGRDVGNVAPSADQVLKWNAATDAWEPGQDADTRYSAGTGLVLGIPPTNEFSIDRLTVNAWYVEEGQANSIATDMLQAGVVTDAKVTDVSWGKITGAPGSLAPTGPAGGDLSGTYPNPTVARLRGSDLSDAVPSHGHVLKWNNDNALWEPAPDLDTDTDTTYSAGNGLTLGLLQANEFAVSVPLTLSGEEGEYVIKGTNSSMADNSAGIAGESTASSGNTYGGYFTSGSPSGRGVYGSGYYGGEFESDSFDGAAVHAKATGAESAAIVGLALHSTGDNFGVVGQTDSRNGVAIYGEATSQWGGRAVHGVSNSAEGYGGYFVGRGYFSGDVGIGVTPSGAYKLEVGGNGHFADNITLNTDKEVDGYDISAFGPYFINSAGTSGQVWTSDGSGRGLWGDVPSVGQGNYPGFDDPVEATWERISGWVRFDVPSDGYVIVTASGYGYTDTTIVVSRYYVKLRMVPPSGSPVLESDYQTRDIYALDRHEGFCIQYVFHVSASATPVDWYTFELWGKVNNSSGTSVIHLDNLNALFVSGDPLTARTTVAGAEDSSSADLYDHELAGEDDPLGNAEKRASALRSRAEAGTGAHEWAAQHTERLARLESENVELEARLANLEQLVKKLMRQDRGGER